MNTSTSGEVIVGVDTSASGRAALEWAAAYARSTGQRLRAVYVFRYDNGAPPMWTTGIPGMAYGVDPDTQDSIKGEIQSAFDSLRPGAGWRLEFCDGSIGPTLVDKSRAAQLLVIGTRDRTGIDRMLSGSVSHYCLSRAQCPLVAIPRRMSASECCTWLRQHHEGRLSYLSGRGPQSVVVSYVVAGDQILLQIPEYNEIAQYAPGAEVTLAVDGKVEPTSEIQPGVTIDLVSVTGTAALAAGANPPPAAAGGFGESWPVGIKISLISLPLTQVHGFEHVREHHRSVDRAWSS